MMQEKMTTCISLNKTTKQQKLNLPNYIDTVTFIYIIELSK